MIETAQIATLGLSPGWTTYNCATLGFGFEFEITFSIHNYSGESGRTDLSIFHIISFIQNYSGESSRTNLSTFPRKVSHGGSGLEIFDSRREVRVTVSYKDKSWTVSMLIDTIVLREAIKVKAYLKSISRKLIDIMVNLKNKSKTRIEILINK